MNGAPRRLSDPFGRVRVVIDVIPDERPGAHPHSARVQVTGVYDYDAPSVAAVEGCIARNVVEVFLGHTMHVDAVSGLVVP